MLRGILTLIIMLTGLSIWHPMDASAQTVAQSNVAHAMSYVEQALQSAQRGEMANAKQSYESFRNTWLNIEDGVKADSPKAYSDIEAAMGQVEYAFVEAQPAAVEQALQTLKSTDDKYIQGADTGDGGLQMDSGMTLEKFLQVLRQTRDDAKAGDVATARTDIQKVQQSWLSVEGQVVAKSSQAYNNAERDMVTVKAMLNATPPNTSGAVALTNSMIAYLSPLTGGSDYTMWDAAMIPIREGLEALLVVAALLAFVKKSDSRRGSVYVWSGALIGMSVSAVLAVLVKTVFSSGAFGHNNFLISGWTGVTAAVMLLYMSYWLHGKTQIRDWNQFLRAKSAAAIGTGRLLSLAFLSFLAIFREGTETVLFMVGMANQIELRTLILGLVVGLAILVVIAILIIGLGLKLPMRPFFTVSSLIVFYLCVKFTGTGLHSLQLAGVLPSSVTSVLPSIDALALYPSWVSAVPQLALVVFAVSFVIWRRLSAHRFVGVMKNG